MDKYLNAFREVIRDVRELRRRIHRLEVGQGGEGTGLPAPSDAGSLLYSTATYNASYDEWDGELTIGDEYQVLKSTGTVPEWTSVVEQSVADVSSPPTDAELDAAFDTPANLGRGFLATVDDNSGDTDVWIVWTTDASWFYVQGTKAV